MRILIISQYYYPDPFRLQDVAEGLVELGHSVTVLTGTPNYVADPDDSDGVDYEGCVNGVNIIRVKTVRRKTSLKSIALSYLSYVFNASLKALSIDKDYDVIFIYQLSPILMCIPAFVAAKRIKRKIGLYCLDLWPESMIGMGITHNSFIYKCMRGFSKYAYNHVDCLAYTSKLFKKYYVEDLRLKQQNYIYIPQFAEDLYQNIKVQAHEGINILFAGNVGESQDVENIIHAAALVKNNDIKWHILGDGRCLEKCQTLAHSLDLEERVFFYGRKPLAEMPYYYSLADAMLVTLEDNKIISYTLPGKVQSYMAAGKAIIGAATGELPLIIKAANCGLCCEPGNPEKLAEIVETMAITDRREYEDNSFRYYQKYFTKEKHLKAIEQMLKNLC